MYNHIPIASLLPDIQDQPLMMLCWGSVSRWDMERLAFSFAYNCCQYCCYLQPLQNYFLITRLTRPKIVDASLTLILKMGLGVSCFSFGVKRLSMPLLCMTYTKLLHNYLTNTTWNRWDFSDAHFQAGAGTVLYSLVPIQGGNNSIMCFHYQTVLLLSDLQDLKLLTLSRGSFCHRHNRTMETFTFTYYINIHLVAAALCCSFTFSFLTTLFFNNAYKYTF